MSVIINPPDYRHDTVLPLPIEVKAAAWAVDAARKHRKILRILKVIIWEDLNYL